MKGISSNGVTCDECGFEFWHPVSKDPPPRDEWLNIWLKDDTQHHAQLMKAGHWETGYFDARGNPITFDGDEVTHWTQLLDAPRQAVEP